MPPGRLQAGSPSWIRIEPCAMPRSLPFGGFWKKFGVCISPPERFEEWVVGAGLPVLLIGGGIYWIVRRRKRATPAS